MMSIEMNLMELYGFLAFQPSMRRIRFHVEKRLVAKLRKRHKVRGRKMRAVRFPKRSLYKTYRLFTFMNIKLRFENFARIFSEPDGWSLILLHMIANGDVISFRTIHRSFSRSEKALREGAFSACKKGVWRCTATWNSLILLSETRQSKSFARRKTAPGRTCFRGGFTCSESRAQYAENLDVNLSDLIDRPHRMAYMPQPARRRYIPKLGSARQRPLGRGAEF